MQHGAAGTRNLETGTIRPGCHSKDYMQNDVEKSNPTTMSNKPQIEKIAERPKTDENNWIYLEKTLEKLHNEIQSQKTKTTNGTPITSAQGKLDQDDIMQEKITQQASDNLKLQTETVRGLRYDMKRIANVLRTIKIISQEGSWYHRIAGKAEAIIRFREKEAEMLIEQGTDAAEGVPRMRNREWKGADKTWEDLKIHAWKAKEALKTANTMLPRYPTRTHPERAEEKVHDHVEF